MREAAALLRSVPEQPENAVVWRHSDGGAQAAHSADYHAAAEEALRGPCPQPPQETGPTPWLMLDGASPPAPAAGSR